MQTFIPYESFEESAKVLDYRRLGKQRVECLQMLKALSQGETCVYDIDSKKYLYGFSEVISGQQVRITPWFRHSATQMWIKHPAALAEYGLVICREWVWRGYKDSCTEKMQSFRDYFGELVFPKWLGDERVHSSHRAALLEKNNEWYSQFGWKEKPEINYYWVK